MPEEDVRAAGGGGEKKKNPKKNKNEALKAKKGTCTVCFFLLDEK